MDDFGISDIPQTKSRQRKRITLAEFLEQPDKPKRKKSSKKLNADGNQSEYDLHVTFANLLRRIIGQPGRAGFGGCFWGSIENNPRSMRTAVNNLRRGVVPMLDMIFLWPAGKAVIELKTLTGKLTYDQEIMMPEYAKSGTRTAVCRTLEACVAALDDLEIPHLPVTL